VVFEPFGCAASCPRHRPWIGRADADAQANVHSRSGGSYRRRTETAEGGGALIEQPPYDRIDMDASTVDHRKSGIAVSEHVRQVSACDQQRLRTVARHKLPGDLAQFIGFCVRPATVDEFFVEFV